MPRQPTLVGNTVLLVIDIQASAFTYRATGNDSGDETKNGGIPHMADYTDRMRRALEVIQAARDVDMPTVYIQEIHRKNNIDYGRELDGAESIHCREDHAGTAMPKAITGQRDEDYFIPKRRYSAFFGTDLEILLKDYYCRVVADSVGGTSDEAHQAALNAMEYLQEGAVMSNEDIIAAIEGTAQAAA